MPLPIAPKKMADTVKVAKTTAKVRVKKSVKQTAALLKTPFPPKWTELLGP